MASEYLKWKARNEKPREKVVLTPAEKRANWWYYHKWHVAIGVILLVILLDLTKSALHIGETQFDYQIAYVGNHPLPSDTAAAAEAAFASLAEDANDDGVVTVHINQYVRSSTTDQNAAGYGAASEVKLMADLESSDSFFFLLDDPEQFQKNYQVLCFPDGTFSETETPDWQDCCFLWLDCPALADQELGSYEDTVLGEKLSGKNSDLLNGLYLARRGFWNKTVKNPDACEKLWTIILKGALS